MARCDKPWLCQVMSLVSNSTGVSFVRPAAFPYSYLRHAGATVRVQRIFVVSGGHVQILMCGFATFQVIPRRVFNLRSASMASSKVVKVTPGMAFAVLAHGHLPLTPVRVPVDPEWV